MADCEVIAGCVFFDDQMADMPATADVLKNKYCRENNAQCARHMVLETLGRKNVPADLFPGQTNRAHRIIDQGKPAGG